MTALSITVLEEKIEQYINNSFRDPDEELFNQLALEVFGFQYQTIPIYQKLCDKRGVTPDTLSSWRDIPAISTEGFKLFDLFYHPPGKAERIFSTSGTTPGVKKGRSFFSKQGLKLMAAAILANVKQYFFPDGKKARIFIIAPSPERAPHMIMACGMNILKNFFGLPGSRFLVGENGFVPQELANELHKAEQEKVPVALIGASLGFLTFFDYCVEKGLHFKLPQGSRTLDAGGYKGLTRGITRDEFLALIPRYLGVPREWSVNLLGMTELGSQFYDNTLRSYYAGSGYVRYKENPPWTRTLVIDPCSLREVPLAGRGILYHLDLANIERVAAIQTDDIGKRRQAGFEILGRARGAEARGCSLSIEEITGQK